MINKKLFMEALKIKYYIYAVIALSVCIVLFAVFQAKALSFIVDAAFMRHLPMEKLKNPMTMLLIYLFVRAALLWIIEVISRTSAARIKYALRKKLQEAIFSAGPITLRDESAGEIAGMAIESIEALDPYFSEYLPQLAISVLAPLLILGFVLPLDIVTGMIMLVTAPLIPVFMLLIGKNAQALSERQWETLSRLGGHFLDIVRGIPTLKLFGRSKSQSHVIARISDDFRKNTMQVLRVSFLSALVLELVATLSTAVVAVSLGLRLLYGNMNFGTALFLLLLVPEYYQPLRQLGAKFHAGMSGAAAAKAIYGFLDAYATQPLNPAEKVPDSAADSKSSAPEILFNHIKFKYEDAEKMVLDNAHFSVNKGEFVALTGPSGSGKSTALSLLMGFAIPLEGSILIKGVPLSYISAASWRENIAYLPQNPYLFKGTVIENIRIAKPEADDNEVISAAKLSGAHEFIQALPSSYLTELNEGGINLSGGQRQQLAIARIFLRNTSYIVMDEPYSNLDFNIKEKLQRSIDVLVKDRTVLIATHNKDLICKADKVFNIQDGLFIEMDVNTKSVPFNKRGDA